MKLYPNRGVSSSRTEKFFIIPLMTLYVAIFAGMAVYCAVIGDIMAAISLALIGTVVYLAVFVSIRWMPYLGLNENEIVVFSGRKRKVVPNGRIVLIQEIYRARMRCIAGYDRKNEELFWVPWQKELFEEFVSKAGENGWKIVK